RRAQQADEQAQERAGGASHSFDRGRLTTSALRSPTKNATPRQMELHARRFHLRILFWFRTGEKITIRTQLFLAGAPFHIYVFAHPINDTLFALGNSAR